MVNLDGETVRLPADASRSSPTRCTLADLDDLREFAADLGRARSPSTSSSAQTWPAAADVDADRDPRRRLRRRPVRPSCGT